MLAHVLAMALCLSVCPSQVGVLSKRFWNGCFFRPILHCVITKFEYLEKNKGRPTSPWNVVLNSGVGKFCHGISIVEMCYQLSSKKVDARSVINWTVVGQLS